MQHVKTVTKKRQNKAKTVQKGSQSGHGANGNLFLTVVLSVVCAFSSKLDVKKHGSSKNDAEKNVKSRIHFGFDRLVHKIWKNEEKKR